MFRPNTPTDNALAERFLRSFKEHKINQNTILDTITNELITNSKIISYRAIVRKYVDSINKVSKKKSNKKASIKNDKDAFTASMLMTEPKYSKDFSK